MMNPDRAFTPTTFRAALAAIVLCFSLVTPVEGARWSEWPPVPEEDLALEDNPASPGSDAMILFKREVRDDEKGIWESHTRIKIFTKHGLAHGDIEIPFIPRVFDIEGLEARVIQPDGSIKEFRGPFYEKTLGKRRRQRLLAKTFALPGLRPGVIIEYRYRMKVKLPRPPSGPWIVQEELFTREAQLEFRPNVDMVSVKSRYVPDGVEMEPDAKGVRRATVRDIPAFRREPYSIPEDDLKVRFHVSIPTGFLNPWQMMRDWSNDFIGKKKHLEKIASQIVSPVDSDREKARKLYVAMQERIRNLSYEESYSKKERKKEGIKERKEAKDVWSYGYGDDTEINMLFAGLCRAVGLVADPVWVDNREDSLWDSGLSLWDQIDATVVVVSLSEEGNTNRLFVDPGTRFAPFGWLSWPVEGVPGMRLGETYTTDTRVPFQEVDVNSLNRKVNVTVHPDGSASGDVVSVYSGEGAFERRTEFFDLPDDERLRLLREELEARLPDATIEKIEWSGMDDPDDEATISFRFRLPFFAQRLGDRMIVPLRLFAWRSAFPVWKRNHPVYLRSSKTVTSELRIELPSGYRIEYAPEPRLHKSPFGVHGSEVETNADAVIFRTRVVSRVDRVEPAAYQVVKSFYDELASLHDAHVVLHAE